MCPNDERDCFFLYIGRIVKEAVRDSPGAMNLDSLIEHNTLRAVAALSSTRNIPNMCRHKSLSNVHLPYEF